MISLLFGLVSSVMVQGAMPVPQPSNSDPFEDVDPEVTAIATQIVPSGFALVIDAQGRLVEPFRQTLTCHSGGCTKVVFNTRTNAVARIGPDWQPGYVESPTSSEVYFTASPN